MAYLFLLALITVPVLMIAAVAILGETDRRRADRLLLRRLSTIDSSLAEVRAHLGIPASPPEFPTVVEHLEAGRRQRAVHAYRDATGLPPRQARRAVADLARTLGL